MDSGINLLVLFGVMILNFGISFWNAYACGAYLTESKIIGGWTRVLVWSGLVMSACGFTWVYLVIIDMVAISTGYITQEQGQVLFELGYLMILIPILGSGFTIWIHSIVKAFKTRKLGDVAVAGWNTYAQVHNTYSAARHAPDALRNVMDFFSGGKKSSSRSSSNNNNGGVIIILLVILALASGIITTAVIARWADRKVDLTAELQGQQTA